MPIETLDKLLEEELRDLYDAEKQITKALPKMAKAASNEELKSAFTEHLEQTKGQVARIEQVFGILGVKAKSKPCEAMKGLITEGNEVMQEDAADHLADLMMIAAAQKIEHYEISGYGSAKAIAKTLGNEEVVDLLQQTEDEESETDEKLTGIAETILGEANQGGDEDEEDVDEDDEDLDEDEEDEEAEEEPAPAPAKKKAAPAKKK